MFWIACFYPGPEEEDLLELLKQSKESQPSSNIKSFLYNTLSFKEPF